MDIACAPTFKFVPAPLQSDELWKGRSFCSLHSLLDWHSGRRLFLFTGYAEVQHFWDKARQKPRETLAQRRQPWSFETVGNVHTTSAYSAYCASVHRPPMNSRYVRGGVSLLQMTDWQLSCEAVVSDAVIPCNLLQRAFDNVLLT